MRLTSQVIHVASGSHMKETPATYGLSCPNFLGCYMDICYPSTKYIYFPRLFVYY